MNINFLGPVLSTDSFTQMASMEILNIILTSDNITDVSRMLIGRNISPIFDSLSGHFRWPHANDHFTLWQHMEYDSPICSGQRIFSTRFGMLASRDRKRSNMVISRKHIYQHELPDNHKNDIQYQK